MKKYNFNLESVLSLRKNIEKEWEAKLGKANNECQIVINRIEILKNRLNVSKKSQVDVMSFEVKCIYEDRLNYQIKQEQSLLKEKELQRDKVKEVYLEKSIERKVIDKLKEKSVKNYKKEILKEEIMVIDDLNSSSHMREILLGGVI